MVETRRIAGIKKNLLILLFFIFILFIFFLLLSQKAEATDLRGHIDTNTTWTPSGNPYTIKETIYLDEDINLTIEPGVEIKFHGSYNFYVEGILSANGTETNKISIRSMNPLNYNNFGIIIRYTGHIFVNHCEIFDARYGMFVDTSHNYIENTTFKYCDNPPNLNLNYYTIVKNIRIEDCDNGIELYRSSYNIIQNVQFLNVTEKVFIFKTDGYVNKNFFNHTIDNCYVNGKPIQYYVEIENTTIENIDPGMIIVALGYNVSIKNCNIANGGGIALYHTQYSKVVYCNVSNNLYGINLYYSPNDNNGVGSIGNIIRNNTAYHNFQGLRLEGSNKNLIINNTIISNNYGIYFRNPVENMIYHNNFINNNYTVSRYYSSNYKKNTWNTSSEGNYWSDYGGTDLSGDGIGDSRYHIYNDNDDHYPLVNPYNGSIPPDKTNPYFTIDPYVILEKVVLPGDWITIMFEFNELGHYEIIIDSDGNQDFDNLSDITISSDSFNRFNRIFWNGSDLEGKNVDDGKYRIQILYWDLYGNPLEEPFILGPISIATDSDDDGVYDVDDAFPQNPRESKDMDGDGTGDNSDTDIDGDGVPNNDDEYPMNRNEWKDTDGDGLGDNEDPDDDNDGIPDVLEIPLGIGILMIPIILIFILSKRIKSKKDAKKEEDEPETESPENQ